MRSFREDGTDLMVAKVHGEHRSIEDTKITQASNRSQATPRDPCGGEQPLAYTTLLICQLRGVRRSYPFCENLARIGPLLRGSCEDSTTPAPGSGHAIAASLYVPWRTQHAIPFSSMLRCASDTLGTIKHVAGPMRASILVMRPPAAAATTLAGGGSVACRRSWS